MGCWVILALEFSGLQAYFFPEVTPPVDELSDPNLTHLPKHPGIKYVKRSLCYDLSAHHAENCTWFAKADADSFVNIPALVTRLKRSQQEF